MTKGKLYEEICSEYDLKHDNHICPEFIQEVLDEAKKAFPADAHGLKVDEVMPWFWKYFGDEK